MGNLKTAVKEFWNDASCGENLFLKGADVKEQFANQLTKRYELEPYIIPFADFSASKGKEVLEIGVGLGADHQMFAQHGAVLSGCDLTERAIEHTRNRFQILGLNSSLRVADAETLPYADQQFDIVYSWGVIHHSPNTPKAIAEIYRVLKDKGKAKIMIYHKSSMVGYMLWFRYGLMKLRPFTSLDTVYAKYLESPGTKAYTVKAARKMFSMFRDVSISVEFSHGDLLSSYAGQRHQGLTLKVARKIYPRNLIRRFLPTHGLFMLIDLTK